MAAERMMIFVDGSNLLSTLYSHFGFPLRGDRYHPEALELACTAIMDAMGRWRFMGPWPHRLVRAYWFGSIQGKPTDIDDANALLRRCGFEGVLFGKPKNQRSEKGVDLAVASKMLTHAFSRNYETAVLVAGDLDYLGLVEEVKRFGVVVSGAFLETSALAPQLRLAFDDFQPLQDVFIKIRPDLRDRLSQLPKDRPADATSDALP